MAKSLKPALLSVAVFLASSNLNAQDRNNFLDVLTEKFTTYCAKYPREELFIQTDRDYYIAGENIWLKAYLFDRQSNKLSVESNIAYLEVLNSENRPVVQKKIKLEGGMGPGQLTLSDSLSTGRYTLRAYTNWMKNFLPGNSFSKTINIFNALKNNSSKVIADNYEQSLNTSASADKMNVSSDEFSLTVRDLNADCISIDIFTSRHYRSGSGSMCYLFMQTHGNIDYKSAVNLVVDTTRIIILKKMLTPGINDIALFDESGHFVAERHWFTRPEKTPSLYMTSSENYKTREKVSIDFTIENGIHAGPDSCEFSISVIPSHLCSSPDLNDYMILASEYSVPSEGIRRDNRGMSNDNLIYKLLPDMKSNWLDWNAILSGTMPSLKYSKETNYHFLHGHLISENSEVRDTGRFIFLSIPGKNAIFQYAQTDKDGDFSFHIPIDDQTRDLIIQPEKFEQGNIIKIESSFSDNYPGTGKSSGNSAVVFPDNISKLKINYQVNKIYNSDDTAKGSVLKVLRKVPSRFYGKPDIELIMDDYIKLPVMQEVFFELLPGVILKNKKSEYQIEMWDPVTKQSYEKLPSLFVDGVIVGDASVIGNMDPELVEKIDVIFDRYWVGDYQFCGIVNVITRTGDFSSIRLPGYAVRLLYRAVDPVNSFSLPDYSSPETMQSRIPDFRNSLYWNPSIRTDNDGKTRINFWSSDFSSDYDINIQGVTGNGTPFSSKKTITIR